MKLLLRKKWPQFFCVFVLTILFILIVWQSLQLVKPTLQIVENSGWQTVPLETYASYVGPGSELVVSNSSFSSYNPNGTTTVLSPPETDLVLDAVERIIVPEPRSPFHPNQLQNYQKIVSLQEVFTGASAAQILREENIFDTVWKDKTLDEWIRQHEYVANRELLERMLNDIRAVGDYYRYKFDYPFPYQAVVGIAQASEVSADMPSYPNQRAAEARLVSIVLQSTGALTAEEADSAVRDQLRPYVNAGLASDQSIMAGYDIADQYFDMLDLNELLEEAKLE